MANSIAIKTWRCMLEGRLITPDRTRGQCDKATTICVALKSLFIKNWPNLYHQVDKEFIWSFP
jgi:hypothetical protein